MMYIVSGEIIEARVNEFNAFFFARLSPLRCNAEGEEEEEAVV